MSPVTPRAALRAAAPLLTKSLLLTLLLSAFAPSAGAQAIGAHRGDTSGSGGNSSIQGHVISPTGKLPDSRVRITLDSVNSGQRVTFAGDDGSFNFNGLEGGSYTLVIDAGKEFEVAREGVFIEAGKPMSNVPVYLRVRPDANPALAGVPKPAVDLYLKALDAEQKKESEKAVTLLGEAVAQHPSFGLAHSELSMLYLREGKVDKAVEEGKAAIAQLPDDPVAQLNYGSALTQKKEFGEAEKQLKRALKKLDKSAKGHFYLGVTLIGLKNIAEAEAQFQQAAKLGGDQMGAAHKYLGGILWQKGDKKRAAEELETYLKLSPRAPDAEQIRATIKQLRSGS
ncbi:MAG TPA: tetratricopeptide repeat protein [Pyrinomonadaceae bacterium]|jgi:Tfp pilus assembly protein PilF|nr:tetratricopeptide repeat protein [Pyrinomonadaceae bacterium]